MLRETQILNGLKTLPQLPPCPGNQIARHRGLPYNQTGWLGPKRGGFGLFQIVSTPIWGVSNRFGDQDLQERYCPRFGGGNTDLLYT